MTATLAKPTCPSWCDGTLCTPGEMVEHAGPVAAFIPSAQIDHKVSVSVAQLDGTGWTSGPMVHITVADLMSTTVHGERIEAGADLSPTDARLLAAALISGAERVERLHAEVSGCGNCGFDEAEHRNSVCPGGCTCGQACDDRFVPAGAR